ncbi:MAG: hypothetical protein ABJ086_00060, partial [Lentilitoribacter sp.]
MQIDKLKKYLNELEPIFDFNILTFLEDDDIDSPLAARDIHSHQLSCYHRLFDILIKTGALPIQEWVLPSPVQSSNNFQNNVPILSHALLHRFETWFDELPRTDAEFFSAVLLFELKRLAIVSDKNYRTGFNLKPSNAIAIAKTHLRFEPNGSILPVSKAEIHNTGPSGDDLTPQHDMPSGEKMIERIRDSVAALDLRTAEFREILS